jgi:phospholipid-transporting ATPase
MGVKNLSTNNKFQEFYINDNNKNKIYKHKNNEINTTKYNFITFLPKSLIIQFSRLSNVYFLATAIIQSIPIISPLSSITAIFPLIFVLGVSMLRDLIEDLTRLQYDRLNNNGEVIVFREKKFINSISSSLRLGELIIVLENEQIPADMILIDSNLNDGMAYVETSTLDGEKNLKPKIANNNIFGLFKNCLNSPDEKPCNSNVFNGMEIEGFCQCNPPNYILNKLDGKILIKYNIRNFAHNEIQFPISERQMLLKGSILKNTSWVVGIVIYTGMNNKIILNSKKPRTKMSIIEKK